MPAEQAAYAVGGEALFQPLGERLRDSLQHLAKTEALGEQAADGVDRPTVAIAAAAAIHADLGVLQRIAHRLRLVDVDIALGLDMELGEFEESRRVVIFLQRVGLGLDARRLRLQQPLGVGGAQRVDLHFRATLGAGLALDTLGADLLRIALRLGPGHRRLGLFGGRLIARFRLGDHVHLRDFRLGFLGDG